MQNKYLEKIAFSSDAKFIAGVAGLGAAAGGLRGYFVKKPGINATPFTKKERIRNAVVGGLTMGGVGAYAAYDTARIMRGHSSFRSGGQGYHYNGGGFGGQGYHYNGGGGGGMGGRTIHDIHKDLGGGPFKTKTEATMHRLENIIQIMVEKRKICKT
jgi:hypothetical protein